MYKFSIVTICKNAEKEIEETVQSVLFHDYPLIEYIIVDGKSTDKTNEIINNYKKVAKEKNISIKHISEQDKGISDAFNKGIISSTGDIIGLINAGDTLLPGSLNKLDESFDNHIDIIYGNTIFVDKKNNLSYLRKKPDNVDLSKMATKGLIFTHQSSFVKKSVYDKIGLYDIEFRIIMDTELYLKFYKNNCKFKYVDYNFVTMLAGGISSKPSKRLFKERIEIGKRYGGVNKYEVLIHYILNEPIRILKNITKKNKLLWYLLIGRKRSLKDEERVWLKKK